MNKKQQKVLVTGGAGFIGSHLVDELIKRKYQVKVLDNLSPPTHNGKLPEWFNQKAEFINGDVRQKKDWLESLKDVDYVFHLASYMDFHLDFSKYFDSNTKSTALLYELIAKYNLPVKKIVVASSQSPYGEGKYFCKKHGFFYPENRSEKQLKDGKWDITCPQDGLIAKIVPEKETDQLYPQIPYAISKLASERLSIILGKIYKISTVALRYSIVQGARQSYRHFYSGALRDFSVQAVAGLPIVMQEDGQQIRDFVNVHDVVDAHLVVLRDKNADYNVFNVGSGKNTRVCNLAKTVCKITGVAYNPVVSGVYRIYSPRNSAMNISKLEGLGWKPKRNLEDSVREYVGWIKNHPEAIEFWKNTYNKMERQKIIRS